MQPELGAPLRERHADIGAEQPREGAVARSDLTPELSQRPGVGRVLDEHVAHLPQQGAGRRGDVQRLEGGGLDLVEQHSAQPSASRGVGVICGVRDHQLAQQRADRQDGRGFQRKRVEVRRKSDEMEPDVSMRSVGMDGAGGHPDGACGGRDPRARVGGDGDDTATGVDDLVGVVTVRADEPTGRQLLRPGGRYGFVADFRHHLAGYRKRDSHCGLNDASVKRSTSILLLSFGHACVDVYQGCIAALVPFFLLERDYTYAAASGFVLAGSVISSVAQPLFGVITDRWAMPWLIPVATFVGGLGIALSGLGGSYGLMLALAALSGLGVSAYHPESARIARIVSGGSHTSMAWFSTGGNLGFAVAPLLVAAFITSGGLAWTPFLIIPALAGIAVTVPVISHLQREQADGKVSPVPSGPDDVSSFVRLSFAVVCRSITFVGLSTFIAVYAQQRVGGGPGVGATALFAMFLGGVGGSILGGHLAHRWDRVTVSRWSYLLTAFAVAGVVILPGPLLFVLAAATSVGLYVPFSLQVTLGQDYLPSRVGTASGITLGLTVSIGGIASPVIGAIADAASLQVALAPLLLLPLVASLLYRTLRDPRHPGATPSAS